MHGGAGSFGHKWQYALVGEFLASQGFLVAVINYRTFPTGSVVDMVEDVENAVSGCLLDADSVEADRCWRQVFWVAESCRSLGGDSSKLFLSGHSSGGHVGALALVNSALRVAVNDPNGFIGLSAPYDIADHYIFESERIVGPLNVMGDNVDCRTDVIKLLKRIMLTSAGSENAALDSPILKPPPSLPSKL
ncbi:unnamed protein product [Phytophthora lilii]|uniref:Unnamed protein product n=1 Tax=Phytophthora lilii TaxID=2077276 RepID=A0A9W6TRT6_9STRA|nr:unnamed protein product [Phytophthora lilii]